tara:strand:- start:45 stop:689 length:645 start_codon:yes stop_codon:yes gene_type:complete
MTITNEDNMELMARYEDNYFDLAIVDPPYGIDIAKWDKIDLKPNDDYFKELFRVSKNQIVWGGNYFNLPHNQGWLCWDKTFSEAVRGKTISTSKIKKEYISEFELAWVSFLKKAKFVRYTNCGNLQGFNNKLNVDYNKPKKIHITEKPIKLYEWLLMNYAKEGDKILDTHLGSGSIAIACHNLGYDFTACELDKEYYDAAIKRINEHKQQLRMF